MVDFAAIEPEISNLELGDTVPIPTCPKEKHADRTGNNAIVIRFIGLDFYATKENRVYIKYIAIIDK